MSSIKLFIKPNCALCPQALSLLEKEEVKTRATIEKFDVSTDIGLAEAAFHQVMATPTILVLDEDEMELGGWRGEVPSLDMLHSTLELER